MLGAPDRPPVATLKRAPGVGRVESLRRPLEVVTDLTPVLLELESPLPLWNGKRPKTPDRDTVTELEAGLVELLKVPEERRQKHRLAALGGPGDSYRGHVVAGASIQGAGARNTSTAVLTVTWEEYASTEENGWTR